MVEKKVKTESKKNRLQNLYTDVVVKEMMKEFGYKNINEVPKIDKIVLNMGLGQEKDNSKSFNLAVEELGIIAGQKPLVIEAKKSVANFKLREGQKISAKVTLRGKSLYDFLDRLLSVALPRVRDFRGVSQKAFDGKGNYALGIKEQIIFPEIAYEKVERVRGFDVIIVTTAKNNAEALALLTKMGFPFKD